MNERGEGGRTEQTNMGGGKGHAHQAVGNVFVESATLIVFKMYIPCISDLITAHGQSIPEPRVLFRYRSVPSVDTRTHTKSREKNKNQSK